MDVGLDIFREVRGQSFLKMRLVRLSLGAFGSAEFHQHGLTPEAQIRPTKQILLSSTLQV